MKVDGKDDIPYILENKKCLKPPTSELFIRAFVKTIWLFRSLPWETWQFTSRLMMIADLQNCDFS
jgi:hypothetical protein